MLAPFWPAHGSQNPSAGAASACKPGISWRTRQAAAAPGSATVITASPGCKGLKPLIPGAVPARHPGVSACLRAGSRSVWTLGGPASTFGEPGMYLAIGHRCWREAKYRRHQGIPASDRRRPEPAPRQIIGTAAGVRRRPGERKSWDHLMVVGMLGVDVAGRFAAYLHAPRSRVSWCWCSAIRWEADPDRKVRLRPEDRKRRGSLPLGHLIRRSMQPVQPVRQNS